MHIEPYQEWNLLSHNRAGQRGISGVQESSMPAGSLGLPRAEHSRFTPVARAIKSGGGGAVRTMRPLGSRCYHGDCRNLGHKQHCVADVSLMEGLVLGLWLLFPETRQGCYDTKPPKIDERPD